MVNKIVDNAAAQDMVFRSLGIKEGELDKSQNDSFGPDDLEEGTEQGEGDESPDEGFEDETLDEGVDGEDEGDGDEDPLFSREADEHREERRQEEREPSRVSHTDGRLTYDRAGNVVDSKGKVLAKAGTERRLFETAHNTRIEVAREKVRNQSLESRLRQAVDIGTEVARKLEAKLKEPNVGSQLGLTPSEQVEAMQLAALSKSSPIDAVKKVLTMATARGIDLTQLGLQGGIDAKSLMEMVSQTIDSKMTPLKERSEQERQQNERRAQESQVNERTTEEVRGFFADNPEALPYVKHFEAAYNMPLFQKMSLGEIWARMQLQMARIRQNNPRRQARSRPNGRHNGVRAPNAAADLDKDYGEILNEVLDKAGVQR